MPIALFLSLSLSLPLSLSLALFSLLFSLSSQRRGGAYLLGGPGPLLGPLRAVLGRSWDLCWRSWAALGAYVGGLGLLLGPMLAVLGGLGAYVGGLGLVLGPMLAVLGALGPKCWLCWRSWVALGAYMGGLGPENAKNMATLKICLFLERERDLRPGGRS